MPCSGWREQGIAGRESTGPRAVSHPHRSSADRPGPQVPTTQCHAGGEAPEDLPMPRPRTFPVGPYLRAARRSADLSQRDLAARAAVSTGTVGTLESGRLPTRASRSSCACSLRPAALSSSSTARANL
ncbi:MAG: helix-turn-helix domain-containing protein [Actinomycetes bacterium]